MLTVCHAAERGRLSDAAAAAYQAAHRRSVANVVLPEPSSRADVDLMPPVPMSDFRESQTDGNLANGATQRNRQKKGRG